MTPRQTVASGTQWEQAVGYSRAVRCGQFVAVAGTTAVDAAGEVVAPGDLYAQTKHALERIAAALDEVGGALADVVRTRLYVSDIGNWAEAGRAHAEVFGDIRPACTMVEVAALIDPRLVVEVEADAVIDER